MNPGVPEAVRRGILGYSPGAMTAGYTHSYPEARGRAVEMVSGCGEGQTGEGCVKDVEDAVNRLVTARAEAASGAYLT